MLQPPATAVDKFMMRWKIYAEAISSSYDNRRYDQRKKSFLKNIARRQE